jgi:hypothetical protein
MHADWDGDLLDGAFGGNESRASLAYQAGNQRPNNYSSGQIWQVLYDGHVKKRRIDHAEPGNKHGHAQCDPKGTDERSPVALLDIQPSDGEP